MSSDSGDVEYVEPKSARYTDEALDDDLSALTKDQIRFRICRELGITTRLDTPFTMLNLNSIYAALTGSFAFPKRAYRSDSSPGYRFVREKVAEAAVVEDYFGPHEGRPFRKDELVAICRAVEESDDERPRPDARRE